MAKQQKTKKTEKVVTSKKAVIPKNSVESTWKCPECGTTSEGHTFEWCQYNGTPTCECGTDMVVFEVYLTTKMRLPTVDVISTVNVIEFGENKTDVLSMASFADSEEGNISAEVLFAAKALENGCSAKDVESHIEDGVYENGTYTILVTHST
jgi:hypothetical protein